jgi:transglutaminase-like putative cysteine protease
VRIPENRHREIQHCEIQPRRWTLSLRRLSLIAGLILLGATVYRVGSINADEWLPISPEELKMTGLKEAPGAPAVILYRQVDRDDSNIHTPHEYNYVREKIFTEEGRKYADAEIPFEKDRYNIVNIRARTIHPDGSVVNFDGKVYEKEIVKGRNIKILAKTFTFSDVQPGSIIEYHYVIDFAEYYVFDSHWILSDELFTKAAKFTLKPSNEFALRWSWPNGLPTGAPPPAEGKGVHPVIQMEADSIPAFQIEDDMPPEDGMKYRVDFNYSEGSVETDVDRFWKKEGKKQNDHVESFIGKKKAMEEAVGTIVAASDSPEVKLQKIYARVQKVRNTSYEVEKTAQEQKRAQEKGANNAEDVWKRGYGDGDQITLLFLGLARAAGLDAAAARISTREDHFFVKNIMKARDLHTYVVIVKVNGKDTYFDPGSEFTPCGMLPWPETNSPGLKLDKDGGAWIMTGLPESGDSRIERKADLKLTQEGSLEGKLTVTYSGLEASSLRVEERHQDETTRKKLLEDQVRYSVPAAVEVELTNKPDWSTADSKLVAEFDLKVPGWVSGAGSHALLPVGIFGAQEKRMYEHTTRVHPLYFHFMSQKADDVTIELPLGWKVSNLPKPGDKDAKLLVYTMKADEKNGTLHIERHLKNELVMLEPKYYPAVRSFYESVRTGDEEQIVLQPMGRGAGN